MRAPVLIIGAHRSGTSATAHALQLLGLQIGQKLDSHFEPRPLQKLHEAYLQSVGASWYEPMPFLESIKTHGGDERCFDYLKGKVDQAFARIFGYRRNPRGLWMLGRLNFGAAWGWKEPRTTLFAPIWLRIFPGARLLHVVRDPIAAAKSIRARELRFQGAGDPARGKIEDLNYAVELVNTYVRSAECFAGNDNYLRVQFEDLQADPRQALDVAGRFCDLCFSRGRLERAAATIRPSG